jgi:uncharacterized membrane protein
MELPVIKLPAIELPFNIPVLLHPPIDHFIIALPVIILLLEVVNLVAKKRAIGVTSFFLLILTVVAAIAAYLTGSVDGKEAFPLLSEAAQSELKEHKLLGTYLMLASVVVLVFKLLSSMIQKGLMKALYLLVLILFVAGILKQGKEGGELVYEYGVNVQKVQELDSDLDDLKEELEEAEEALKKKKETPVVKAVEATTKKIEVVKKDAVESVKEVAKSVEKNTEVVKEKAAGMVESVKEKVEKKSSEVKEKAEELKNKVESAVEVVPTTTPQPQIETH